MSKLSISANHKLSHNEALQKIKIFFNSAPKKFSNEVRDLNSTWNGSTNNFSFKIGNAKINGTLAVNPNTVILVFNIPFAFLLFKKQIEKVVLEYASEILKK